MVKNILALGDVCGQGGLDFLLRRLRGIKKAEQIAFTVVNGENASVVGLTPTQAEQLFEAGADVITLGNHAFTKQNLLPFLEDNRFILRPDNLSPLAPGRGWGVYDAGFGEICVINLIGRVGMAEPAENPFYAANRIVKACGTRFILVDIHAEATSEKAALAWHLDGAVSAVWGTHTHVQTSDGGVLPRGTGFITDLGMTGPVRSILGIHPDQSIARFLGDPKRRPYQSAEGPCKAEGAVFSLDTATGKCVGVKTLRVL